MAQGSGRKAQGRRIQEPEFRIQKKRKEAVVLNYWLLANLFFSMLHALVYARCFLTFDTWHLSPLLSISELSSEENPRRTTDVWETTWQKGEIALIRRVYVI
jgi:hypothetical protein